MAAGSFGSVAGTRRKRATWRWSNRRRARRPVGGCHVRDPSDRPGRRADRPRGQTCGSRGVVDASEQKAKHDQLAHYVALIPAEATVRERVMSGVPAGRYTIGCVLNAAEPKGGSAASAALLHNPKK